MKLLLVSYDDKAHVSWFPLNLGYLASAVREAGHDVEIWEQDVTHLPDEALTAKLDREHYDFVGIGVVAGYYQYAKIIRLCKAARAAKRRPKIIIGGHGPSAEPEYFLRKTSADFCCVGEAERSIIDVMEGRTTAIVRGELIEDLDSIPMPAYHLFNMHVRRLRRDPHASSTDFVAPVLAGRGCKYKCTFCYRMDPGLRLRSPDNILDEVEFLQKEYGITYIRFADELLMSSASRTMDICERILAREMSFKWSCSGRLNYATGDVLTAMTLSGCVFINYGIEAMDDDVLRNMKKGLNVDMIERGVKATLDAGISPGLNIIWGNIGDTKETLDKAVDFLLRNDDQGQLRTIRPVTPYPGTELYDYAIEHGLLSGVEEFYEKVHVNSDLVSVNFTDMTDNEMHYALHAANTLLLSNYYAKLEARALEQANRLYLDRDISFRGFRHG